MNSKQKKQILINAQDWFKNVISINHLKNTKKLVSPKEFNINPFLVTYLSNFLTGNSDPISIAKALVYPRVLGQSITTSFGQNIQTFVTEVLSPFGSTTSGIDIEFIDACDGDKKYCQLKAGPNTINKDDVETIANHFSSIRHLARTNNVKVTNDGLIVGVIYGDPQQLSSHYKRIEKQYFHPVFIGQEFWKRLTNDEQFYFELIRAIAKVSSEADSTKELEEIILELSETKEIIALASALK